MNNFSEQLKKRANTLRLSDAEQRDLKSRIASYMEYYPITSTSQPRVRVSSVSAFLHNFYIRRMTGALVVVMLVSVPFIAEHARPGDMLYPIKLQLNEELRSTITQSPYEKVVWETELLERRLSEARELEREGRLTPEMEVEVAEAVRLHSDAAQESIENMRQSDSDEAALAGITLASALHVQSEMIEGHSVMLFDAVEAARVIASNARQENPPSYERLLGRIETESTHAAELLDTIESDASQEEVKKVEERLARIREDITLAKTYHAEDPTDSEAVKILADALVDTRKVISFMTNIDVRDSVTLDELIPDDLTDEERIALIELRMDEVATMQESITTRAENVDENTQKAIEERLDEVALGLETASTAIAEGAIEEADEASLAVHVIALELAAMLNRYDEEMNVGTSTPTSTSTSTATSSD